MRAFIAICLMAATFAAPQGYNYQQSSQQHFGNVGAGSVSSSGNSHSLEAPHFLHEATQNMKLMQALLSSQNIGHSAVSQQHQQQQQQPLQYNFNAQPQFQTHNLANTHSFGQAQQQFSQYPTQFQNIPAPIVTKDIYVHVAPQEQEEQRNVAPLPVLPPRKHYRIVFIKTPTPSVSKAALRVSHAPTEEKTIIYVLTKKPDPVEFEAALQEAAPRQPSKPEVYFIKYKTQEEAQHAQRTIQAQYDQLGGTSQVSDEGVAPVTSVIGSLDQQGSVGTASGDQAYNNRVTSSSSSSGTSSGSNYLPPIVRL